MSQMIDVGTDEQRRLRLLDLAAQDRAAAVAAANAEEEARRANRNFVQVYPKGWARLQLLMRTNPPAARLYAFLAEHIDESCGAVVASQELIADALGVSRRTIIRQLQYLAKNGAVVSIKVGVGVNAYALDPDEVWKAWDDKKDVAAFRTKTLVRPADRANREVRRKLKLMIGEPELDLE